MTALLATELRLSSITDCLDELKRNRRYEFCACDREGMEISHGDGFVVDVTAVMLGDDPRGLVLVTLRDGVVAYKTDDEDVWELRAHLFFAPSYGEVAFAREMTS